MVEKKKSEKRHQLITVELDKLLLHISGVIALYEPLQFCRKFLPASGHGSMMGKVVSARSNASTDVFRTTQHRRNANTRPFLEWDSNPRSVFDRRRPIP